MLRLTRNTAIALLIIMGIVAYASAWNDAAVVDEDPHIGAGISYLTQQDMRLNPEHPPLMKDLAALPLLLIPNLHVPTDHPSWTHDLNGQWDFGRAFLFQSGNNADLILHLARIAPILIMLLLGWFVFVWARELGGTGAGFLALLFYVASPVVLAHGRLVTTDVPAAAGIFIATYFFFRYIAEPTRKRLLAAGLAFGIAQLLKFSAVLLIPYFAILAFAWLFFGWLQKKKLIPLAQRALGGTLLIGVIGLAVIWLVYSFHVWHYPPDRQIADTEAILQSSPSPALAHAILSLAHHSITRPLAEYFLGVAMVLQRASGGNTTYYLGEVSAVSWQSYFPLVYLLKMPLAFHFLSLLAAVVGLLSLKRFWRTLRFAHEPNQRRTILGRWYDARFPHLAMVLFLVIYWYTSLSSNLNIGVRHLMPTLPFLFVLTALGIRRFLRIAVSPLGRSLEENMKRILFATASASSRYSLATILMLWLFMAGLLAWPHYIASFNELAHFKQDRASWVVDSNLDWGQDLKRLSFFVKERGITTINVDYFGWTPPEYYVTTANVVPWHADLGQPHGWLAVSATYKQQACAEAVKGFDLDTHTYCFLNNFKPKTVIGGSIYVYQLP